MEQKYEAILCLFPLEMVLIGPVVEPVEDMLGAGGRPARLGLGKPRAFRAVGRLGGCYPTRSNQFLITINNKDTYHLFDWNQFGLVHLHGLIHCDHCRPYP